MATSYVRPKGSHLRGSENPIAVKASHIQGFTYTSLKRFFDLFVCLLFLPITGILLLLLTVFVICTCGFPVFYKQDRIGRHGKTFRIYKFRTMRMNSAQLLSEWLAQHPEALEEWKACHKLKNDPRITRGGRFLRQTSLDELPQILNVFRGEMSLVGPRPVVADELVNYGRRVSYYLAVVPGLTGLWQVSGRCNVSYDQRVRLDERYVKNWSLWEDMVILFKTPMSVIRRDGAC